MGNIVIAVIVAGRSTRSLAVIPKLLAIGVRPPVLVTYEAQGARFDVTLEPGSASRSSPGFVRVRAPRNMAVSMPDAAHQEKRAK